MFWIPISVIILILMGLKAAYDKSPYGFDGSDRVRIERSDELYKRYGSPAMEDMLWEKYGEDYLWQNEVVREFMGGDPIWEKFRTYGSRPAFVVYLAKHGKLPRDLGQYHISSPSLIGGAHGDATRMLLDFILRIQEELRSHGIMTKIAVSYNDGEDLAERVSRSSLNTASRYYVVERSFNYRKFKDSL